MYYIYISLLEQPFVFPGVNDCLKFLFAHSICITTTASSNSLTEMKKKKNFLNHILIHEIIYDFYTLAPHLGNTFPRFPHLPNPIRFGSFLHLYSAVILEILFPHWGRALASWILVSFFIVPHQNEESIPVVSGERVHAMKVLLHLFILATYKI